MLTVKLFATATPELPLDPVCGDHAVLQCGQPIERRGFAKPGNRRAASSQSSDSDDLADPANLAGQILVFPSDLAAYDTGAALLVDGGAFVNLQ